MSIHLVTPRHVRWLLLLLVCLTAPACSSSSSIRISDEAGTTGGSAANSGGQSGTGVGGGSGASSGGAAGQAGADGAMGGRSNVGGTSSGGNQGQCTSECCSPSDCPEHPHARATCDNGVCGSTCENHYGDCDGQEANGCEVDLRVGLVSNSSVLHCGACGVTHTCGSLAARHATASCENGVCVPACQADTADAHWRNCSGVYADGCNVNVTTSVNNCGECGTVCNQTNPDWCPNKGNYCSSGTCFAQFEYGDHWYACSAELPSATLDFADCEGGCYFKCTDGRWDCDGERTNGCESDTSTSPSGNTCQNNVYYVF